MNSILATIVGISYGVRIQVALALRGITRSWLEGYKRWPEMPPMCPVLDWEIIPFENQILHSYSSTAVLCVSYVHTNIATRGYNP
jgi:hypothetical protein